MPRGFRYIWLARQVQRLLLGPKRPPSPMPTTTAGVSALLVNQPSELGSSTSTHNYHGACTMVTAPRWPPSLTCALQM